MLSLLQVMSANNPEDEMNPGEDEAGKSQRKRERERQRRTEMAGAFNDLAQLLSELDPDNVDNQSTGRRRRRRGSDSEDFDVTGDAAGMTRLLLINRATAMLRNLHSENGDLKLRLRMGQGNEDKVRLLGLHHVLDGSADFDRIKSHHSALSDEFIVFTSI